MLPRRVQERRLALLLWLLALRQRRVLQAAAPHAPLATVLSLRPGQRSAGGGCHLESRLGRLVGGQHWAGLAVLLAEVGAGAGCHLGARARLQLLPPGALPQAPPRGKPHHPLMAQVECLQGERKLCYLAPA